MSKFLAGYKCIEAIEEGINTVESQKKKSHLKTGELLLKHNQNDEYEAGVMGYCNIGEHNFYYSLSLLAQYHNAEISEQQKYLSQVAANQEKMQRWAYQTPANYQHKYDLVEAEKARVLGQNWEASEFYERAITGAKEQGYNQEEALALELAAEFYFSHGRDKIAQTYLTDAYYGYIRWGATVKVRDLESKYPQLNLLSSQAAISLENARYQESQTYCQKLEKQNAELKLAEAQLLASLQEKEVLLKEIHHRVKNNLQIISSLLNLQSDYVEEPQTLAVLQSGQNRVASMALIHEQLYQSADLASIDFAEYIQNLAVNLFSSYEITKAAISYQINIEDIYLGIDEAIPCGLIINELISNSLKYAFPAGKPGEICIDFHSVNENHLTLIFRDNGIGIPSDLDWQNTDSLGLQLVNVLTNQLGGTLELNRNLGTEFKLTFPKKV